MAKYSHPSAIYIVHGNHDIYPRINSLSGARKLAKHLMTQIVDNCQGEYGIITDPSLGKKIFRRWQV